MSNIIHAVPIDIGSVDLLWMVGYSVTEVILREPTLWVFTLSGGGSICTESSWRVLADDKFAVSDSDEYPSPATLSALSGALVTGAEIRKGAADLVVSFSGERQLEIVSINRGYEAWQIYGPAGTSYAAQGGQISTWKQ